MWLIHTCTVIASEMKLALMTFANLSTTERCKRDIAACNRMRDLTFGLLATNRRVSKINPVEDVRH